MNTLANLFRVSKWQVEKCLMWEGRDFWLLPSNCEPRYPIGSTQERDYIPPHFVKVNAAECLKAAAELLNGLMRARGHTHDEFPTSFSAEPLLAGKWATVVSCAFAKAAGAFRDTHCRGDLGRDVHYYFEHPEAVDCTPLAMGCDWVKERPDWNDKPGVPLVVPFYDSFTAPGFKMRAIGLLASLPHWKVKAPVSLMQRAKRPPTVSLNMHGTGPKNVYQDAYRQTDIVALWEWLGLPWVLYFKPLHSRHLPKGYIREAFQHQSSVDDQDREPDLE